MKFKTSLAAAAFFLFVAFTAQAAYAQKAERKKNNLVGLPDLVITNARLVDSDKGTFEVTLMNKGKGKAPWGVQLQLTVWDYNGKIAVLQGGSQPEIGPGEKKVMTVTADKLLSSMKYEFVTDYTKQLTESNELNNTYKGQLGKY
jgi:hypothetical protein